MIFNTSQTEDCSKIDRSDPSFKTTIDDTEDLLSYLQFIELFLPLIVTCIVSIIKGLVNIKPLLPPGGSAL